MFTGLIEKVSKIEKITLNHSGAEIFFTADFDDVKIGDSVALNGACLTITSIENNLFCADVMPETLNLTNLKTLKNGDLINLERAAKITSRLDGHIVMGHIDTTAKVESINQDGFSKRIRFNCNSDLIVKKGSVAVNGVSLTVSNIYDNGFEVSLIPATIENTNLKILKIGDNVNIEYDIIAKYIQKFAQSKEKFKITQQYLEENGF